MLRTVLGAKIHRARVTDVNIDYEGSLDVDQEVLERVDMIPGERVEVYNITTGSRFTTYLIAGQRGSRMVRVNGAAARLCAVGDELIVATYRTVDESEVRMFKPRILVLDEDNNPKER